MSRRRHTPEQIITALREVEVGLANGKTVGMVSRELGISEQTYYRWRQEGLKVPRRQPKRSRLWLNDGSCIRLRPLHKNHVWSYDFVSTHGPTTVVP